VQSSIRQPTLPHAIDASTYIGIDRSIRRRHLTLKAAVADGSNGLALRLDYSIPFESSITTKYFKRNSMESDASHDLSWAKRPYNPPWPTRTRPWSALYDASIKSMQDMYNHYSIANEESSTLFSHHQRQWEGSGSTLPLNAQWQQANDQGIAFDYSSILGHNFQQLNNHNMLPSSSHNSFNTTNMQLATSNLLQRRIEGKQQAINIAARGQSQSGSNIPQNGYGNLESIHPGRNASPQQFIDSKPCTDERRPDWSQFNDVALSPPRFVEPPMLQQSSQHWMQRDRVHSRQSSRGIQSPNTPSSGDVSRPFSLTNSSGPSLDSSTSPEDDFFPSSMLVRSFDDMADDSGQEDGTAHTANKRRSASGICVKDTSRKTPSYATLRRAASGDPAAKKNISKVVAKKYYNVDGAARSANDAVAKKTRHLCPIAGCDKHFSTSGHARRHSRIHASLRPFECPHIDCDATFTRRDNCSQHQKSRHRSQLTAHRLSKEDQ
jgi:hypothetical protein